MQPNCHHPAICYNSSPHAAEVGYKQPTQKHRIAATKPLSRKGHKSPVIDTDITVFPAPLVLPGDDLALDPECPPQSFQQWLDDEDRNEITSDRKTIYVIAPPATDANAAFMRHWTKPEIGNPQHQLPLPQPQDIVDYLAAFYHGLPVKLLQLPDFRFVPWDESRKSSKTAPRYIGLAVSDECIGIRTRACPDQLYLRQLNLDDLLDVSISLLPKDAYALCLLVNHDLFEDDDDTFVCGRAYGGSRVAVVSSARYCPSLDGIQSVERQHAWPASNCKSYVQTCCKASQEPAKRRKTLHEEPLRVESPLTNAISAISTLQDIDTSQRQLTALWLARMCRTASHELGHCFGLEHCVYYACIMQGSASLSEDTRQPPYLCPVDLAKLLYATGTSATRRYRALQEYCNRPENRDTHFCSAFSAWLESVLERGHVLEHAST